MGYDSKSVAMALGANGGGRWLEIPVAGDPGQRRLVREGLIAEIYGKQGDGSSLRMVSGEIILSSLTLDDLCSMLGGLRHLPGR